MVPISQALQIARDAELDLVEVSPGATPPVCRVMDFGKFIYERAKKEREAKKSQTKIEVKEIRLRPKTTNAHRGFKVDDARRWLLQGHKVRVTIRFRGREMDYPEIALEDLKEIAQSWRTSVRSSQAPMMEGRTMLVVLAPGKGGKKKEKPEAQPEVKTETEAVAGQRLFVLSAHCSLLCSASSVKGVSICASQSQSWRQVEAQDP